MTFRENLGLEDRALEPTPERIRAVAESVRRWRPRVVLAPYERDRHPDHAAASRLVREGVFSAGLARYGAAGAPHRVQHLVAYVVNSNPVPDFVVDVSDVYEVKRAALRAYASQFAPVSPTDPSRLTTPVNQGYLERVELRDAWYGSLAGVRWAEGLKWAGTVRVGDLVRDL